jgi:hypothetical protein
LKASARLFERTARRHKSNKDLERTVLYLRSLYNQAVIAPALQQPSSRHEHKQRILDELSSDDEEGRGIARKVCFMVSEDKLLNFKKSI